MGAKHVPECAASWLRLQREDTRPWLLLCAVMAEARKQSRSSGPMQQRHFNTTVAIALRPKLQETGLTRMRYACSLPSPRCLVQARAWRIIASRITSLQGCSSGGVVPKLLAPAPGALQAHFPLEESQASGWNWFPPVA
jgi:hypothetical protein